VPIPEIKLAAIILAFLVGGAWLARQELYKILIIYVLGCFAGWLAQLGMGPGINRYTPNITLYVSYVSVGVILAWGTGLSMMWAAHLILSRWLRRRPGLGLYLLASLPVMTVLEFIGSNVIHMKLQNYQQYTPLMPALNSMHAPVWLFICYGAVAALFYWSLVILRISTGEWRPVWESAGTEESA
jgi:hypothetical protein